MGDGSRKSLREPEHWLDTLAKRLAVRASRRQTLARAGAGLLGGALAALLPRRLAAYGLIQCTPGVTQCPPSTECIAGLCLQPWQTGPCPRGWTACGGRCIDTQADPSHCGNCTTQCPYGVRARTACARSRSPAATRPSIPTTAAPAGRPAGRVSRVRAVSVNRLAPRARSSASPARRNR